jgi:alpha-D-xyloside xylohydrolase
MRIRASLIGSMGLLISCVFLVAASQDPAAPGSARIPRRITSFEHVNQEVVLKCDVGSLVLKAYADNIVQVRYFPGSAKAALPMRGIIAAPAPPKYRVDSTPDAIILSTAQLTVSVERRSVQVTFLDQKQNPLLTSRQFRLEPAQSFGEDTYRIHAEFIAPDDEVYYGLGQHGNGWMDQRGQSVRLWHDAQPSEGDTIAIPFLVTDHKYGFILDNPSKATVVPGKNGVTTWDAQAGDALSYFVIYGNTTDDLYKGYRSLTGITPLPPKAGLGYIQGVPRSCGQDELLQMARNYREKNWPADVWAIDPGEGDLDEKRWPDPVAMTAELDKLGFKAMVSYLPRIPKGSAHFDTLDTMGCLAKDKDGKPGQDPRGFLIDASKNSCATWIWNDLQEHYLSKGFASWWLNGSQPDLLADGLALNAGAGAGLFNYFPSLLDKAVFDGQRRDSKERCLILARSAYLGAQQYGTTFGSAAIVPQWKALKAQIPAGLNLTASGLAWWSSAIGGTEMPGALSAPDDYSELFTRWFEFASFCPTFRSQASIPQNENVEKAAAKYLGLRYRLLPYLYSLAHSVTETGAPFMRALFMDFPSDPEVRGLGDEYMFGPAFLVAPIVEKGKTVREVYLPKGAAWYDYWTGKKFPGGQRLAVEAPLDVLPLFVRAGSIIPHGNEIANTRTEQREIELWVYPGADAQFNFYQDDGTTYEYEKGKSSLAQIRWSESTQKITVTGDDRKLFSRPQDKWLKIIR